MLEYIWHEIQFAVPWLIGLLVVGGLSNYIERKFEVLEDIRDTLKEISEQLEPLGKAPRFDR